MQGAGFKVKGAAGCRVQYLKRAKGLLNLSDLVWSLSSSAWACSSRSLKEMGRDDKGQESWRS